ncbi:hypothetical protein chiPu_0019272 [Chiloscyllium punctatum]|uniref:VWFD domain-containing protein n=1 Tax=Chiloscyllium punctatum TaxID=137246 RepID=A0A401RR77_CHIPU|nr:hypothetical protein [Chiloscyllium punctatum]
MQIKALDGSVHSLLPGAGDDTPPQSSVGNCYTWGRGAFRTFQDDFFYFASKCNFILSRQCKGPGEDFNIQIRRGTNGNLETIHMLIEGVSVVTANETVRVKDVTIKLPYDDKIIAIQKYGIYTRIYNRKHTISVMWNHRDALSVTLDTKYKNQTCGLCGSFQEGTDINTDSDNAVYNIMVANQLDVLGQVCVNNEPTSSTCSAASSCIHPLSMYFSICFANPTFTNEYLKLCKKDVCACGNKEECACATFEELSRQCTNLPIRSDNEDFFYGIDWKEWSSKVSCVSPDCPENQFYQECGAACIPTCSDPETQQQCDQCVNTCECPDGTVLDDIRDTGKCIDKTACPCEYSGMIYNSGQIRNMSCHSCVCQSGMWECFDISCPGRCKIEEGTHFTTFDNKYYTLKGDCLYYAVVTKAWSVKVELRPCQIAFKQTCLQRVVFTNNQTSYTFNNDGNVYSEGNKVGLPLAKGLCGIFNDNANDDFLSAQNIVENAPVTFANSWEAESNCPGASIFDPCVSSDNEHYAKQHCSKLKDPMDAFAVCHSTVDYTKYYEMCVTATCACENINDCLCAGLGAYVHECAAYGIMVRNWKKGICKHVTARADHYQRMIIPVVFMMFQFMDVAVLWESTWMKTEPVWTGLTAYVMQQGGFWRKGRVLICTADLDCPQGKVFINCNSETALSAENLCERTCRTLNTPCGKQLILTDNHVKTVEKFTNQTQCTNEFYSHHTVGLYLILQFSHGITVIWDKSTRFSITLDSRWKNNVCGLCGNFNDDVSDDLTTKGNSLVTSAVEFGNSWKCMACSDTVNQTSPCDRNPYCLAYAQRKCGIIKTVEFQACHRKVDPTPFYDACVQEACACDLEGKYLGFCTAVAVYAEACNKAGVCVDWRTPERCPVYCDYYNTPGEWSWHYQPCGTLTQKTCSEHSVGKKYSAILEGCV